MVLIRTLVVSTRGAYARGCLVVGERTKRGVTTDGRDLGGKLA